MRTSAPATRTGPDQATGFSLVEVLLALVILGGIIAGLGVALNGLFVVDQVQEQEGSALQERLNEGDRQLGFDEQENDDTRPRTDATESDRPSAFF